MEACSGIGRDALWNGTRISFIVELRQFHSYLHEFDLRAKHAPRQEKVKNVERMDSSAVDTIRGLHSSLVSSPCIDISVTSRTVLLILPLLDPSHPSEFEAINILRQKRRFYYNESQNDMNSIVGIGIDIPRDDIIMLHS